jgi:biopolymer transport protein ExbD
MINGHPSDPPISQINTTPLIDVMLVLLIMFIITIPMQTHAVKVDLPSGPPPKLVDTVRNTVVVTGDGRLLWNDAPVSTKELASQLAAVGQMVEQPELHFRPQPDARYELVDDVLALTKRAHVTRLGFVGNERYAAF